MSITTLTNKEAFRVNDYTRRLVSKRKRRIAYRLRDRVWQGQDEPMMSAGNIHYEMADRTRAVGAGGRSAFALLQSMAFVSDIAAVP